MARATAVTAGDIINSQRVFRAHIPSTRCDRRIPDCHSLYIAIGVHRCNVVIGTRPGDRQIGRIFGSYRCIDLVGITHRQDPLGVIEGDRLDLCGYYYVGRCGQDERFCLRTVLSGCRFARCHVIDLGQGRSDIGFTVGNCRYQTSLIDRDDAGIRRFVSYRDAGRVLRRSLGVQVRGVLAVRDQFQGFRHRNTGCRDRYRDQAGTGDISVCDAYRDLCGARPDSGHKTIFIDRRDSFIAGSPGQVELFRRLGDRLRFGLVLSTEIDFHLYRVALFQRFIGGQPHRRDIDAAANETYRHRSCDQNCSQPAARTLHKHKFASFLHL